ncbi:putative lipid II flippase FtsW [Bermanella sp. R86510]|uniref:putative lipid II flippase FtsW n=1 Tax=unclassified Bermanella TaxID=2627862 RepID=UPI0037C606BA
MSSATSLKKPVPIWQELEIGHPINLHKGLVWAVISLSLLGWLMVTSASMDWADKNFSNPFYISARHGAYLLLSLVVAWFVLHTPLNVFRRLSGLLIIVAIISLIAVLIPGIGKEINGSMRWIPLGFMNVQPSEFAKIATVLYMASFLERRREEVQSSWLGFFKPLFVILILAVLLLLEPDFGGVVVLMLSALALLFLGGVKTGQFILTAVVAVSASIFILAGQTYRLKRLTGYREPWTPENVYGSGYQLTQSLIAFGRGEYWGVGLGDSIQKLFYLPEAHTDFVFAIWAEETGLIGAGIIIALFAYLFVKGIKIARHAHTQEYYFAAFVAYGTTLWLGFQSFINLGVNMGLLPTKGLTLPFVSFGGSSLLACFIAVALLLRVYHETGGKDAKA